VCKIPGSVAEGGHPSPPTAGFYAQALYDMVIIAVVTNDDSGGDAFVDKVGL
jgi:hypothetical protein